VRERKLHPPLHGGSKPVEWVRSDWYCYKCGVQNVWQEADSGCDYYVGHSAICHTCGEQMQCMDRVPR
jgi:hypothetical protein